MLHGFGIIERRLAKRRVFASLDPYDFGDTISGGEFDLLGGQRRAPGIHKDIHGAKATAAFLRSRRLRLEPRRQPK